MPEFAVTEREGKKWAVPTFNESNLSGLEVEMLEFMRDRKSTEANEIGINWPRTGKTIDLRELVRMELSLSFGDLLPETFEVRRENDRVEYKFDQLVYETHARV